MVHVTTVIQRTDAAVVAELSRFSAATIHEAQGRKGALDHAIKPIDPAMSETPLTVSGLEDVLAAKGLTTDR